MSNLLARLYRRNSSTIDSLDLNYQITEMPADLEKLRFYRKVSAQALDLLIERQAIEAMSDDMRRLSLIVWWRRFNKLVESNEELFSVDSPFRKTGEKDSRKNVISLNT